MSDHIVFETLVYRIGIVTASIFNSVLIFYLFRRKSNRLARALKWIIPAFLVVGVGGYIISIIDTLSYLNPYSKQVGDIFFAQVLYLIALHYVASGELNKISQ